MEDYRLALLLEEQIKYDKKKQQLSDYELAQKLQKEFEIDNPFPLPTKSSEGEGNDNINNGKSLVDPSWEVIDPTPNIHTLFVAFNQHFFWCKLGAVSVEWSKRMTSCAGICYYHPRAGRCNITLSEPLLKLRPRSDLVETLLHEMIHAYLFVTHNNRDRDGHGPEFHKHMYRINKEAGTNITVYHTFHDEVRLYKQHWWKCNGPCQHKHPFYGIVRRAMNRAPGPNDRWWGQHQSECGGTFVKVKEPEKKKKGDKENAKPNQTVTKATSGSDLRNFFPVIKPSSSNLDSNLNKSNKKLNNNENISNIQGFNNTTKLISTTKVFNGSGNVLGITNKTHSSSNSSDDYSKVRDHWLNKFENTKRKLQTSETVETKKPKFEYITVNCPVCNAEVSSDLLSMHLEFCITNEFIECDICEELICSGDISSHKETCILNSSTQIETDKIKQCPICNTTIGENIYDSHIASCVIKGFDNLAAEFDNDINEKNEDTEMTNCLVCDKLVPKAQLGKHLNECMSDEIFNDDIPNRSDSFSNGKENSSMLKKKHDNSVSIRLYLSSEEEVCFINDTTLDEDFTRLPNKSSNECSLEVVEVTDIKMVKCPVCQHSFSNSIIQDHVNLCLDE